MPTAVEYAIMLSHLFGAASAPATGGHPGQYILFQQIPVNDVTPHIADYRRLTDGTPTPPTHWAAPLSSVSLAYDLLRPPAGVTLDVFPVYITGDDVFFADPSRLTLTRPTSYGDGWDRAAVTATPDDFYSALDPNAPGPSFAPGAPDGTFYLGIFLSGPSSLNGTYQDVAFDNVSTKLTLAPEPTLLAAPLLSLLPTLRPRRRRPPERAHG